MNFKEQIKGDLNIFFNPDEFGEEHIINKKTVNIIIDDDELDKRVQKVYDGLIEADVLYFIKVEDIEEPTPGDIQFLDGIMYTVIKVKNNSGIYEVMLQGRRN